MEQEIKDKLNEFYKKYHNECLALKQWLYLNSKNFPLIDALKCIYDFSEGKMLTMVNCIKQLTAKDKKYGRANAAYGNTPTINKVDIRKNENGVLEFYGFNPNFEAPLKGQHRGVENNKIFRNDGQVSKTYQNAEEKIYDLGKKVRELFPNYDNVLLTQAIQSIKKYASLHKINPDRVIKYLKMGRLTFDEKTYIIENINSSNNKVIVITEEMANRLNDELTMTEYKFNTYIKKYLHDLLVDPINASVPEILQYYGYNRSKLINLLKNNQMLFKEEEIVDKDENGEDRTATMRVKYKVPKKNFDRKLRNLYIKMFERNVPETIQIEEEGEGGCIGGGTTNASSSGQYSQPLFPMNRRTMYGDVDEDTTTTSVGNYQYDVPFCGDKETLARKNGKGGSVSINKT